MTASEFAFLALGLVLGVATGAALVEVLRARPPAAREIRVTVAPNSIQARRATTLSETAFPPPASGAAADRPGDPSWTEPDPDPSDAGETGGGDVLARTSVRRERTAEPLWLSGAAPVGAQAGLVAVPMSMEPDPITDAMRATAEQFRLAIAAVASAPRTEVASAMAKRTTAPPAEATTVDEPGPSSGEDPSDAIPCAEERRVADERCAVATRAREGASGAAEALRVAQRAYDTHLAGADAGAAAIDPRFVRASKETAQARFRDARAKATTREDVEAAARIWLTEINQINHDTRDATHR
ncbi:MAG TPA: hypothetical protein VHS36_10490, partial [Candidatus Limnocylindrales bacterium]|nr:hypothetical protein [Candidatus Limnocylindrales bacterium]